MTIMRWTTVSLDTDRSVPTDSLIDPAVIHVMGRRYLPISPGNENNDPLTMVWASHAIADPLLFLSTLNLATIHLDVLNGQHSSPVTIARKCEAIRRINARVQSPNDALTNETIGSVVMLAAMEVGSSCQLAS